MQMNEHTVIPPDWRGNSNPQERISDILLGLIETKSIRDARLEEMASRGVFDAVAVASMIASKFGLPAMVAVTDEVLSGVVTYAFPSANGDSGPTGFCWVDMGIVRACNGPARGVAWPKPGRVRIMVLSKSPAWRR